MTVMWKSLLLVFLLCSATRILGLEIRSEPAVNAEGLLRIGVERTVSLTCQTSGTEAEQELVWLRNGALVKLLEGNKMGSSSICVTPTTREDDSATFTCHVKGDASVNSSVTLDVTYAPMLTAEVEEVTVEDDQKLLLQCDVHANPPVTVSWNRDGDLLDLTTGSIMVTSDGFTTSLFVKRVDRGMHQGTYQCVTVSTIYGTQTKTFKVTVTDKTFKFPLLPMIAGLVVVALTTLFAVIARWKRIVQCCK